MTDAIAPGLPAVKYRLAMYGGGTEELDKFALRDRIRSGEVTESTDVAMAGSEDWRPASTYPELARYFQMAVARQPERVATATPAAKRREIRSMGERVLAGLLYPLTGGGVVTLIAIAIVDIIPVIGILATLGTTLMMLEIIRKSADGSVKMPPFVDTSDIFGVVGTYLKVIFVTLVSLAPVIAFGWYAMGQILARKMDPATALGGVFMALGFAALYYPACLATVAVWNNVLSALNPLHVFRVISRIGIDYFIVIAMWFVATVLAVILNLPALSPVAQLPVVGAIFSTVLSLWVLFYASHLLGYAVHRHAKELGWD